MTPISQIHGRVNSKGVRALRLASAYIVNLGALLLQAGEGGRGVRNIRAWRANQARHSDSKRCFSNAALPRAQASSAKFARRRLKVRRRLTATSPKTASRCGDALVALDESFARSNRNDDPRLARRSRRRRSSLPGRYAKFQFRPREHPGMSMKRKR